MSYDPHLGEMAHDDEQPSDYDKDLKQQFEDSDRIFNTLTSGNFTTFEEAQQAIVYLYIPDMSFSRAGISHALKRLERHFGQTTD